MLPKFMNILLSISIKCKENASVKHNIVSVDLLKAFIYLCVEVERDRIQDLRVGQSQSHAAIAGHAR